MQAQELQYIPPGQRDPFTVFYKYADSNLTLYNRYAQKYFLVKLSPAYVIARNFKQNKPQGWN